MENKLWEVIFKLWNGSYKHVTYNNKDEAMKACSNIPNDYVEIAITRPVVFEKGKRNVKAR